jgi:integrase
MKIHNDFTLYFRVVPSGKRVVYYYAYDAGGRRLFGRSTGETTLTAARRKCNQLLKEGLLVPNRDYIPTFAEYAVGWWDWETCDYLAKRRKHANLTKRYADTGKWILDKALLPYFGKMRIDQITVEVVEAFRDKYIKDGFKHTTVNSYYSILKTMLTEAEERKVIAKNPIAKMKKLINNRKEIQIITPDEFKKLFLGDWRKVWNNDRISYTANKLAALSGMRAAEVIGLRGCNVFDEHIFLCEQFDNRYGCRPTKTKDKRNIPLPSALIADLNELKKINGEGYVFSADGGIKPMSKLTVYVKLRMALENIGISKGEIAERKLHLHAWRHFFNTQLLKSGLSVKQVQAFTGHKSQSMTDLYYHFEPDEFRKAMAIQEALLQPDKPKDGKPQGETKTAELTAAASGAGSKGKRKQVIPFPAVKTA